MPKSTGPKCADLADADHATSSLVQALTSRYQRVDPGLWLAGVPDPTRATFNKTCAGHDHGRSWKHFWLSRRVFRRPRSRIATACLAIAMVTVSVGVAFAASNIVDLGKPTNTLSTNAYFPIDRFHRTAIQTAVNGRARVYYFGDLLAQPDAAEVWPLVKALGQFGSFHGVRPAPQICTMDPGDPKNHVAPSSAPVCLIATYDLSHAQIQSRYLSLVFHSMANQADQCTVTTISSADWSIFVRYAHARPIQERQFCREWNHPSAQHYTQSLTPLVIVGSYVQTASQIISAGDFTGLLPPAPGSNSTGDESGLPFDKIRSDLAAGRNPPDDSLVQDVNGEANIITALICHADGRRPSRVCGRSVIKQLLSYVK